MRNVRLDLWSPEMLAFPKVDKELGNMFIANEIWTSRGVIRAVNVYQLNNWIECEI